MKKTLSIIAALLVMLPASIQAKKDNENPEIKVMSYNIRHGRAKDGTNSWPLRYPATAMMIEDQKPDVFGVQEALDFQILFIEENCRDYESIGVGREDGKKDGEFMSIFYNKKNIKVLKWGTYWLSETPDTPSKGWDAQCYRTATWALMKDKRTGKKFYYVNTHLDHKGAEAQKNGLALIVERIAEMNPEGLPMILTGDFNVTPDNPVLNDLNTKMKSAQDTATKTDDRGTFNGWGKKSSKIDYIYYSGFSACPQFEVVTKKYADRTFISDHFPITAVLVF